MAEPLPVLEEQFVCVENRPLWPDVEKLEVKISFKGTKVVFYLHFSVKIKKKRGNSRVLFRVTQK